MGLRDEDMAMKRRQLLNGLAASVALAACPGIAQMVPPNVTPAGEALFDAEGYRRARYRAPVDRKPTPARQIALADALRFSPGKNALFIDVLPAEGGVRDPETGQWTLAAPHETIPGALWFPEVGRAPVDVTLWAMFIWEVRLMRVVQPLGPIVVFCRADCWMSWNAARRLALVGVPNVRWLAEGIDGWHDAARPLAPVQPQSAPQGLRSRRPKV